MSSTCISCRVNAPRHGRFVKLVPNERVVEVVKFETSDPAMRGEMTITISLAEAGWRSSRAKLAALVEAG
jgi:hypothetical protein